ncbi:MAG: SGNH/GDSL hydrolase family protein [Bdellovibrionota bacterium]
MSRRLAQFLVILACLSAETARAEWAGTWMASPQQAGEPSPFSLENTTVRENLRVSVGGSKVRLRFSNLYGKSPLILSTVTVGKADPVNPAKCLNALPLRKSGKMNLTLAPGTELTTDALNLELKDHDQLCVSFHLPKKTEFATIHAVSQQTDFVAPGNQTSVLNMHDASPMQSRFFLSGVDIERKGHSGTIVAIGDSITDGQGSSMNANHRWTDFLSNRLHDAGIEMGVLNAGISANRLLRDSPDHSLPFKLGTNTASRFEREVLGRPEVTHAVVLIGINDLGHPGSAAPLSEAVSAEDLIAGYKKLIRGAHAKGIKIFGGTLPPFQGVIYEGYYTEEKEKIRQTVNRWIREGGAYDGVVDFDLALRNPAQPLKLLEKFDSGDHIHPSDAGYKAMAEAVNLQFFAPKPKAHAGLETESNLSAE